MAVVRARATSSPEDLAGELRGPYDKAERALVEVMARVDRDQILAEALAGGISFPLVCGVVAALGDASGPAGTRALKEAFLGRGRGSASPRGLAALAIAKRTGAAESVWLASAFDDPQPEVRGYVLRSLAGAADDSAWDKVFSVLPKLAARKILAVPSDFTVAVAYLAQHVESADRRERLVTAIRRHWTTLTTGDHAWLEEHWVGATPAGADATSVTAPDVLALQAWAREPLFRTRWPLPNTGHQNPSATTRA